MLINTLFSFLCHQGAERSFVIAGHMLPFCQRCTGLYVGMGIACVTLGVTGAYRKGLPPRSILYTNIGCLLIMPVFGYHLLDPGPAWRLWAGLIYGAALINLCLPAAVFMAGTKHSFEDYPLPCKVAFWSQFMCINTLALWLPVQTRVCLYTLIILAGLGLLAMTGCLMIGVRLLVKTIVPCFIWKGTCHGHTEKQKNHCL